MTLETKRTLIAILGATFLASLVFVQWEEVTRRQEEAGLRAPHVSVPASSRECVDCHAEGTPGITDHWEGSTHAVKGVACVECHEANEKDADAFSHYGATIATVVTPQDCGRCHQEVSKEFQGSRHAHAAEILASLDNRLAEVVEGNRIPFNPHSREPWMPEGQVDGLASVRLGCQQCHGSKVALQGRDGNGISVDELKPDEEGIPTNAEAVGRIVRNDDGRPLFDHGSWPNTGIGRKNLDGSIGSCSACHSRHDFSPRRARQPENCGRCHLGPDHPQKEIYEESKHGIAYRDLRDQMNLDAESWVLGQDYAAAPTCATCHMSGNLRNKGAVTHDPGRRISWWNRPPVSLPMDTDADGNIVTEIDPEIRKKLVTDTAEQKRRRMKDVCGHCHTPDYVAGFYKQYDALVTLYNEKFAKPGRAIMGALTAQGLLTKPQFDEKIEWTWFYLWHHEGRRARHGASMQAPDYTHWHGMYEVAERFYEELIPEARELIEEARRHGKSKQANTVAKVIDDILARPEHVWLRGEEGER